MVLDFLWVAASRLFVFLCGGQVLLAGFVLAVAVYAAVRHQGRSVLETKHDSEQERPFTSDVSALPATTDRDIHADKPRLSGPSVLTEGAGSDTGDVQLFHKPGTGSTLITGGIEDMLQNTTYGANTREPLATLQLDSLDRAHAPRPHVATEQENSSLTNNETLPNTPAEGKVKRLRSVFESSDLSRATSSELARPHELVKNDGDEGGTAVETQQASMLVPSPQVIASNNLDGVASAAEADTASVEVEAQVQQKPDPLISEVDVLGLTDNCEAQLLARENDSPSSVVHQTTIEALPVTESDNNKDREALLDPGNVTGSGGETAAGTDEVKPLSPFATADRLALDFSAVKKEPDPTQPPVTRSSFGNLSAVEVFEAQLAARASRNLIPAVRPVGESIDEKVDDEDESVASISKISFNTTEATAEHVANGQFQLTKSKASDTTSDQALSKGTEPLRFEPTPAPEKTAKKKGFSKFKSLFKTKKAGSV